MGPLIKSSGARSQTVFRPGRRSTAEDVAIDERRRFWQASCTFRESGIGHGRKHYLASAFAVTSTTAVWRCKEGWDTTANKVDNFKTIYDNCYLFYIFGGVHPKISYGEARAYCQDNGGNLATFQSQDELVRTQAH